MARRFFWKYPSFIRYIIWELSLGTLYMANFPRSPKYEMCWVMIDFVFFFFLYFFLNFNFFFFEIPIFYFVFFLGIVVCYFFYGFFFKIPQILNFFVFFSFFFFFFFLDVSLYTYNLYAMIQHNPT